MLGKPKFTEPFCLRDRHFRHGKNNTFKLHGIIKCKSRSNRPGLGYEADAYGRTDFPMYSGRISAVCQTISMHCMTVWD